MPGAGLGEREGLVVTQGSLGGVWGARGILGMS